MRPKPERRIYRDERGAITRVVTLCARCRREFLSGPVGDRGSTSIYCTDCAVSAKRPARGKPAPSRGRRPRAEDELAKLPRSEPPPLRSRGPRG